MFRPDLEPGSGVNDAEWAGCQRDNELGRKRELGRCALSLSPSFEDSRRKILRGTDGHRGLGGRKGALTLQPLAPTTLPI